MKRLRGWGYEFRGMAEVRGKYMADAGGSGGLNAARIGHREPLGMLSHLPIHKRVRLDLRGTEQI